MGCGVASLVRGSWIIMPSLLIECQKGNKSFMVVLTVVAAVSCVVLDQQPCLPGFILSEHDQRG